MKDPNARQVSNDQTLSLQEAADFLHLGYEATKALVNEGAIPALILNQKHAVLLRDDVVEYIREESRKQAAERRRKCRRSSDVQYQTSATDKTKMSRRRKMPDLSKYEALPHPRG